jgi:cell division protein FtsB
MAMRLRQLVTAPLGWLAGRWPLLLTSGILAGFAYSAIHGQRGFFVWVDLNRETEAVKLQIAEVTAEREALEQKVQGLRGQVPDRDLLEQELRKLGYVRQNEVIVLTPETGAPD